MNKFFKILGKVAFISLIADIVIYGILGIGILMRDKFGLRNGFTDVISNASNSISSVYYRFYRLFSRRLDD